MPARDVKRIEPDGKAWIDDGKGGEEPVQIVVGSDGSLGIKKIDAAQALGIDQVGGLQPPPTIKPPGAKGKTNPDFDTSGLDQG